MNNTVLDKYIRALKVAKSTEKLGCHINNIQSKIIRLSCEGRPLTALDEIWVDYFLDMNELKDWYFTCTNEFAGSMIKNVRRGTFTIGDGAYLEVYKDIDTASYFANGCDTKVIKIRVPNRLIKVVNPNEALVSNKVLQRLQYTSNGFEYVEKTNNQSSLPDERTLDTYMKLLDFVYIRYEKQKDKIVHGVLTDEMIEWLVDRLFLKEATDEQLNELWHAIDKYFDNCLLTVGENGELKYRDGVDVRWYLDCDSAWKTVVNMVANSRRNKTGV